MYLSVFFNVFFHQKKLTIWRDVERLNKFDMLLIDNEFASIESKRKLSGVFALLRLTDFTLNTPSKMNNKVVHCMIPET